MRVEDSATRKNAIAVGSPTGAAADHRAGPAGGSGANRGSILLAGLGVLAFSLTFPSTVWGLESFGPWSLVALRTLLAVVIAGGALLLGRVAVPDRRHRAGLVVVAAGVVIGFPLLTTLALQTSTTSHAAVVVGLLPLTTAVFSSLRTGARPPRAFWAAALAGAGVVIAFTVQQSGGELSGGDLYLFGALLVCAAGYTEGAGWPRSCRAGRWSAGRWCSVCRSQWRGRQSRCRPSRCG